MQGTINKTYACSATSGEALFDRSEQALGTRRTAFTIVPLSAGVTVTVALGDVPAVADAGIVLSANQPYSESSDGGFECWQGAVQIVASGAGNVAIRETLEY